MGQERMMSVDTHMGTGTRLTVATLTRLFSNVSFGGIRLFLWKQVDVTLRMLVGTQRLLVVWLTTKARPKKVSTLQKEMMNWSTQKLYARRTQQRLPMFCRQIMLKTAIMIMITLRLILW